MAELAELAKPSVASLFQSDTDQLYEQLGVRIKALSQNPAISGSFAPDVSYDAQVMGPLDNIRRFGRLYFNRVNRQCHDLVCGQDSKDTEERKKVVHAFGLTKEDLGSAIAALLVAHLGLAPAIAAVVAVLIMKLFFRPALDAMCQVWSEDLRKAG
jgi:hypothetical protein